MCKNNNLVLDLDVREILKEQIKILHEESKITYEGKTIYEPETKMKYAETIGYLAKILGE